MKLLFWFPYHVLDNYSVMFPIIIFQCGYASAMIAFTNEMWPKFSFFFCLAVEFYFSNILGFMWISGVLHDKIRPYLSRKSGLRLSLDGQRIHRLQHHHGQVEANLAYSTTMSIDKTRLRSGYLLDDGSFRVWAAGVRQALGRRDSHRALFSLFFSPYTTLFGPLL